MCKFLPLDRTVTHKKSGVKIKLEKDQGQSAIQIYSAVDIKPMAML